ncbi:hypothetical protein D3C81_1601740 [compost metagenome]
MIFTNLRGEFHIFKGVQIGDQVIELKDKADFIPAVPGKLVIVVQTDIFTAYRHVSGGGTVHPSQDI